MVHLHRLAGSGWHVAKTRLAGTGNEVPVSGMKPSSKCTRGIKILAAVAVPALSWWFSWHFYHASKQADETIDEEKKWEQASKDRRDLFVKKYMDGDTIEATEVRILNTWKGPTDPDSVWHAQRERANRILMQHGLSALDGRKPLPDSVPLSRFPEAESGQK